MMRMKASISSARPVKFAKLSSSLGAHTFLTAVPTQMLLYDRKMRSSQAAGRAACANGSMSPDHSRDQRQVIPAELAANDQRDHVGD
jgi:hypothetical protein